MAVCPFHVSISTWQLTAWPLASSKPARESLPARQKLWSHITIEVTSPWGWRIQLATSSFSRSRGWYSSAVNTKRQGSRGPSAWTATQKKFTFFHRIILPILESNFHIFHLGYSQGVSLLSQPLSSGTCYVACSVKVEPLNRVHLPGWSGISWEHEPWETWQLLLLIKAWFQRQKF